MDYATQISTSGVLTSLHRQDVLAGNLANLNTVGYKASVPDVRQRDPVRAEDGVWHLDSDLMLEKLGAGVVPAPTRVDFSQGPIDLTGNDLDLAIEGEGFFAVRDGSATALTRDGRLTLDAGGRLVLASSGRPVLGVSGQPITLPEGARVTIASDGTISADGEPVGALRFVQVAEKSALIKRGDGLFGLDAVPDQAILPASGRVVQGAVEGSAVNEIKAMLDIQAASRAVGTNIGMISYLDRMTERAINTFGRLG